MFMHPATVMMMLVGLYLIERAWCVSKRKNDDDLSQGKKVQTFKIINNSSHSIYY
jgi:hypothetical protein